MRKALIAFIKAIYKNKEPEIANQYVFLKILNPILDKRDKEEEPITLVDVGL